MNIGGLLSSVVNPANIGLAMMGPGGWAAMAFRTIGSAVAQQVIQQVGQRLGLPQSTIDMAQAAFAQATGNPGVARMNVREAVAGLTQQHNLSPQQQGELVRAGDRSVASMNKILDGMLKRMSASDGAEEGGSVLMRIARALGGLMDEKMNNLASKADQLGRVGTEKGNVHTSGGNEGGLTAKGQGEFGKLSAEVQALGQEIGYLSQAISSTIKSIGEAASTVARK